jgi:hypothetical protein
MYEVVLKCTPVKCFVLHEVSNEPEQLHTM